MSLTPYDVILRPVITERATDLQQNELPQYVFQVATAANKVQIRHAVETLFNVKVHAVNTLNRLGKMRRMRNKMGRRAGTKRAIVTLHAGEKIVLF